MSATAVFEEEITEVFHQHGIGPVDELAALTLDQQQLGADQFLEVKAKRCLRNGQLFYQRRGCQAIFPSLNDQAEYVEPGFLTQCEKGCDCVGIIHISNYMEIKMTWV
jgi:hypothetical protein